MIKDRALKLILVVSLITAVVFPLFSILYIYPAFTDLLVENTEEEAVRTGKHLSKMLINSGSSITQESLPDNFMRESEEMLSDFNLMKIKVFASTGEIIFSTDEKEIGKINRKPYFQEILSKGKTYSKVVQKDSESLEGQVVTADVVETYVPVMVEGNFRGAFELYYNISKRSAKLKNVMLFSSLLPLVLMLVFLVTIVTIIVNADKNKAVTYFKGESIRFRSPYFPMAMTILSIVIAEIVAMVFISLMPKMSDPVEILFDTCVLIMLTSPIIYFFVVQPLMKYIDEHKRIEQSLRESQDILVEEHEEMKIAFGRVEKAKKEWEETMDCVGEMILLVDENGKIKRMNKAVRDFVEESYQNILDKKWEDFISDYKFEIMLSHGRFIDLFHKPTGKLFELNFYQFGYNEDGMTGNVITIHDTTEIKKVTEELELTKNEIESREIKLQSALHEISSLIQVVTKKTDTSIRLENPRLRVCYEVKDCKKEDCPCYDQGITRCWQVAGTYCGGKVQGAFAQKYGNCSECNVYKEATSDPIYEIGEQFNNMMHVLEVKNKELEDAYSELKHTQSRILQQEKMASIGQLAAGVAHEINNPMGFISSNLGTLERYMRKLTEFINIQGELVNEMQSSEVKERLETTAKKLKLDYILEDVHQLIEESLEGAERVKQIVQNLKSFSRVDEAEHKAANINECVESTLNIVWNELKYKAKVEKEYGEIPMTKCYPQQLNQVFMNLLVNAAQAIEKQGEIRIRTWSGDGMINISISDTGQGIEEDKLNRIFEPFYTTKEVGKGTGLGLSISYDIVKKHNGDITVESEDGKGTQFTISIPVAEEDETSSIPVIN